MREAAERGTIPQRKGGHTEDTEKERYSLPAMLAQRNGILCVQFPKTASAVYLNVSEVLSIVKD
jgi:hypothetical protein